MSDIKFYCTSCGKKLGIDAQAIGLSVSCPKCGTRVRVPEKSEESVEVSPLLKPTPMPPRPVSSPLRPKPSVVKPTPTPPVAPPPEPPKPAPPVTPPAASPVAPPVLGPPVDTAALEELKRKVEKLEEQNKTVSSELAQSRDALAKAGSEKEALQKQLSESAASLTNANAASEKKLAALAGEKERLEAEKVQLQRQVEEMTAGQGAIDEQANELEELRNEKKLADARLKGLEDRNAALADELKVQAAAADKMASESGDASAIIKDLKARNEALTKEVAAGAVQIESLTSERKELLVHRTDAKALSNAMTDLQEELKILREQESKLKQTVEDAEDKISKTSNSVKPADGSQNGPWQFNDPFQRTRKWMVAFAGIAVGAVLCSVFFIVLWPVLQNRFKESPPVVPVERPVIKPAETGDRNVELGERFVIDGVEVVVTRARIAPVEMILLLGYEEKTEESYFVLDVELINRNTEHDLVLRNPWKDTKLVDDMGRLLRSAFTQPMQFQEVRGVTLNETVALDQKIESIMVFEWEDLKSESFTLTVDPGFKKPARDGMLAQISYDSFVLNIPRKQLEEQQE